MNWPVTICPSGEEWYSRKFPVFKGLGARGYPRNSKRYGVVVRVPTLVSRGEHDGRLQGVD